MFRGLNSNLVEFLPPTLFAGTPLLRRLFVWCFFTRLLPFILSTWTTLKVDIFRFIFNNYLTSIPSSIFSGLSGLEQLCVFLTWDHWALKAFKASWLHDLFQATHSHFMIAHGCKPGILIASDLYGNYFVALPPDLFLGLSSLLELFDNRNFIFLFASLFRVSCSVRSVFRPISCHEFLLI